MPDETPKETPKNPLCFVLMPFGIKTEVPGRPTNFDAVYQRIIAPAVQKADLDPGAVRSRVI